MLNPIHSDGPLYLLREMKGLVTVNIQTQEEGSQQALAVFTHRAHAARYAARREIRQAPVSLTSMLELSRQLLALPKDVRLIGINPSEDGSCEQWIQVSTILEVISQSWFVWGYPLYLLRQDHKYVCLLGNVEGMGLVQPLCLFTDEDLAERYCSRHVPTSTVERIESATDFLDLLERLPSTLATVVFDPPDNPAIKQGRWCVKKADLLAILQSEPVQDFEL